MGQSNFQCVNQEFVAMKILSSRVNDGICDCCDGSDETSGIVKCNNTCAEVGAELMAKKRESMRIQAEGYAKKQEMIVRANEELDIKTKLSDELRKQIQEKEQALIKHEETKKQATEKSQAERDSVARVFKQQLVQHLEKYLPQDPTFIVKMRKWLSILGLVSGEMGMESMLKDLSEFYELPGREPDDTEALVLAIDYGKVQKEISVDVNGNYQQTLDDNVEAMMQAISIDRLGNLGLFKALKTALIRASKNNYLAISIQLAAIGSEEFLVPELQAFIDNLSEDPLNSDTDVVEALITEDTTLLDQLKLRLADNDKILNKDYGPNNELYELHDKCFSVQDRKFSYEVCPFGEARQDRRTSLGHYSRYVNDSQRGYALEFDRGERCFNTGLPRSLLIKMECTESDTHLVEVHEPNICQYVGTLNTPIACTNLV